MPRKQRPLPITLQCRPKRTVHRPCLAYYSGDRLIFRESETLHLPRPRVNPQHRAGAARTCAASLDAYLFWVALSPTIRTTPYPAIGSGRFVVRVHYPNLPEPVDSVYTSTLKAAHRLALGITTFGGLKATAHERAS